MSRFTIRQGLLCMLGAMLSMPLFSQTLQVRNFYELEPDRMANGMNTTNELYEQRESLIKVRVSNWDYSFSIPFGAIKIELRRGEMWIYVPSGSKSISISHPTQGNIDNFYFNRPLESGKIYYLELGMEQKQREKNKSVKQQITFSIEPENASVFIDEASVPLIADNDGYVQTRLAAGFHTFCVTSPKYKEEYGSFFVVDSVFDISLTLESIMATLSVMVNDAKSEIWLDDEYVGRGAWSGKVMPGFYEIEARKDNCISDRKLVYLEEQENLDIVLIAPQRYEEIINDVEPIIEDTVPQIQEQMSSDNNVYMVVDEMPVFPGGQALLWNILVIILSTLKSVVKMAPRGVFLSVSSLILMVQSQMLKW